ncbi:type VI secretion system protein ImpH [Serratia fonticola]|uniref:Type VI secretion system protein ImpH n=1 Tax=Serratia fonticola TaxID=47917 RepID=A0A542D138_SERFO|nr:type VI secretion system baseplate subunit TssG [Serratia fonticola]TQI81182.1 type VI secretion system protein ImpH [Serratia fonticola]TQI96794.1 type VI secretion system protein ImpH [Serratia fonticola]TVZ71290.1 type VI secretion system protein ImpH [Serratia fonticola]
MERKSQRTDPRLIEQLAPQLYKTNFYRFCQLLEQATPGSPGLGSNSQLSHEPVRFRPHPGMGFPVSELKAIEIDPEQPQRPPTVRTTFLGLYGVESPLPTSYLDDIAQQREGTDAVADFLDIFNHRLTTQFYRIWRKYSYPATFQPGGTDETSQCLLGLVGLGIPGTAEHIGTPVSRFLALLGTLRLPTRTAEGIVALVKLLAADTQAKVTPHDRLQVALAKPVALSSRAPQTLSKRPVLGAQATDVNSQLLLTLYTEAAEEAKAWLPGGALHSDLMALLQVYLGARCHVRLQLSIPRALLPTAQLRCTANNAVQLGRTAALKGGQGPLALQDSDRVTVSLGRYQGVTANPQLREAVNGNYQF